MLVEFDFAVTRTAYVKAVMDQVATFRPDGLTPANVQALVDDSAPIRAAYVTKKGGAEGARALRHTTIDTLHEACIDFLAQGSSRFRKNPGFTERFNLIPVKDQTFQETLTRAAVSEALWTVLPMVGTPPAVFVVGQGTAVLALAGFTGLIGAARGADQAIPAADEQFQGGEADVHVRLALLEDFVTAALEQGRSQFNEGTPQRELLDAIPSNNGGGGGPPPPALPGPPQNVVVTTGALNSGEVSFSWDERPPEEGVTSYNVYRDGTLLASPAGPPVTFGGFTTGDTINLTVSAVSAAGEGPQSVVASGAAG